jgi:hypothetical protein
MSHPIHFTTLQRPSLVTLEMMSEPLFTLLSFLTFVSGSPVSSSGHHMDTEPIYGFGAGASGVGLIVLFLHMLVWGTNTLFFRGQHTSVLTTANSSPLCSRSHQLDASRSE